MTLGKQFGNGFPVTAVLVSDRYKSAVETISASTSYGGNPMACAAALASIRVIREEQLVDKTDWLGGILLERMRQIKARHPIVGDVRGKGLLLGLELVKDRSTKEPFDEAGREVYQRAFRKGVAWIPAGHILRLSPPMIIDESVAMTALEIIEESIDDRRRAAQGAAIAGYARRGLRAGEPRPRHQRGAGNLLGEEQSGHIREVGYELYQSMLEEAVAALRGGDGGRGPVVAAHQSRHLGADPRGIRARPASAARALSPAVGRREP